jgi:hydrogenase-4 component F
MSGVLLPVAVYALIRYRVIAVQALSPAFVRTLLLAMALASLALAASLIIAQRDYKRLLAYSSIEHMALVVIGLAIGTPLAIAAGLLHILGHGLGKAVLFCGAGQVLVSERTTRIAEVTGLLGRRPVLAGAFGAGFLALLGLPPFSLFVSELGLARAAAEAGLLWVIAVALTLLVVIFVAIAVQLVPMILGSGTPTPEPRSTGVAVAVGSPAPLLVGLSALVVLGVVAWPLDQLLHSASLIGGIQ